MMGIRKSGIGLKTTKKNNSPMTDTGFMSDLVWQRFYMASFCYCYEYGMVELASKLKDSCNIEVEGRELVHRYITNPLTSAIVIVGLEPFDSWEELQCLIMELRYRTSDDIVIYSGYTDDEIPEEIHKWLSIYAQDGPIIVKYGRYLPNQNSIFNEDLGVTLSSDNQYTINYANYN